jgi:hypothetical protein
MAVRLRATGGRGDSRADGKASGFGWALQVVGCTMPCMRRASLLLSLLLVALVAQADNFPKQTYGRMTLPAGVPVAVPAACLQPRSAILLYNLDAAQVCCGGDANVTCSGVNGGFPITAAASGVPGSVSLPLNCGGSAGVIFCYSAAGTISQGFGWWEIR